MSRSKKSRTSGSSSGKSKATSKKGSQHNETQPRTPGSTGSLSAAKTFTLRDTASYTDRHHNPWTPSNGARRQAMTFIKSTHSPNTTPDQIRNDGLSNGQGAGDTGDATMEAVTTVLDTQTPRDRDVEVAVPAQAAVTPSTTNRKERELSRPSATLDKALTSVYDRRSPSPDSDEDVVVFQGRKRPELDNVSEYEAGSRYEPKAKPLWDDTPDTWVHREERKRRYQSALASTSQEPGTAPTRPTNGMSSSRSAQKAPARSPPLPAPPKPQIKSGKKRRSIEAEENITALLNDTTIAGEDYISFDTPEAAQGFAQSKSQKRARRRRGKQAAQPSDSQVQAILDDYVENLKANGEVEDMAAEDSWEDEPSGQEDKPSTGLLWNQSDIAALGDISTSDEVLGEVQMIVSRRERSHGIQYLVIWENQTMDEARWVPPTSLTTPDAVKQIKAFDTWFDSTQGQEQPSSSASDESGEGESEDSELDSDEQDDVDDEADLEERRLSRMTDEHIARLLSKQEELGLGSDQLVLHDQEDDVFNPDDYGRFAAVDKIKSKRTKSGKIQKSKQDHFGIDGSRSNQREIFDVEAEGDGDGYGTFDVMDWNRASLNRKGGKNNPIMLSDSELERDLNETWSLDRKKKKAQKAEREELRAQGLLGGKKNKWAKPANGNVLGGMSTQQFRWQLESFLDSDEQQQQLNLCAMDKKERKMVHCVAGRFGLNSKSSGQGTARHPVLFKTKRTRRFDAKVYERAEAQALFGHRPDYGLRGRSGGLGRRPKGAANGDGIKYREGETVGAAAAELGAENRGHAMLQKMGWSKGMALGALENKGILDPIAHVVKTGRSGLR